MKEYAITLRFDEEGSAYDSAVSCDIQQVSGKGGSPLQEKDRLCIR